MIEVENHMVIGDYYPKPEPEESEPCKACFEPTYFRTRTERGIETEYCRRCRERCSVCNDWMLLDEEVLIDGKRTHKECADDVLVQGSFLDCPEIEKAIDKIVAAVEGKQEANG